MITSNNDTNYIDGSGKFEKFTEHKNTKTIRPLNVDLQCELRVIGYSKPSITLHSDEGDGYEMLINATNYGLPELKSYQYMEWADQLLHFVDMLKDYGAALLHVENQKEKIK